MNAGTLVTGPFASTQVDPVEEMRLRTWARRNYAPETDRSSDWHPVVLEEMLLRDREEAKHD